MAVAEALRNAVHVEIMQIEEAQDTVIQNARGHKTYLNVEVPYITDNGEIKTTKNTIGIHVTPRKVKNIDIKTIFRDLDPQKVMKSYVKTTKGEEKFIKDFLLDIKNIESIAKMNADGGNLLAYVRKENLRSKFNSYVYPFLFFMLDEVVTKELNDELKINLDSMNEREKYIKQLMALGILTYDSGTDIIDIYYDGDTSIQSITMDDFVLSASKYEKEIQQLIRLNQNR
jgi:DNA-binding protein YbaB